MLAPGHVLPTYLPSTSVHPRERETRVGQKLTNKNFGRQICQVFTRRYEYLNVLHTTFLYVVHVVYMTYFKEHNAHSTLNIRHFVLSSWISWKLVQPYLCLT